jgi:hypothetical protein
VDCPTLELSNGTGGRNWKNNSLLFRLLYVSLRYKLELGCVEFTYVIGLVVSNGSSFVVFLFDCLLCSLPMGGGSRCDPWTPVPRVRALAAGLSPPSLPLDLIDVQLDTAE